MRAVLAAGCVAVLALWAQPGFAACSCSCVNGAVQAICTSPIEVKPICAARICPPAPPRVTPLVPPAVPPVGTTQCHTEQVLNPQTGQYQFRRICR